MSKTKSFTNYHKVLGFHRTCIIEEVQAAYQDWAQVLDSDKTLNDPNSTEQFQLLVEAYDALCDSLKREYHYEYCQGLGGFQTTVDKGPWTEDVGKCSAGGKRPEHKADRVEKVWRQVEKKRRGILKFRHYQLVRRAKADCRSSYGFEAEDTPEWLQFVASENSDVEVHRPKNRGFDMAKRSLIQENAPMIHEFNAKRYQRQSRAEKKQRAKAGSNKDAEAFEHQRAWAYWKPQDQAHSAESTPEQERMGVDGHRGRKSKKANSRAQLNVDSAKEFIDYVCAISQPALKGKRLSAEEVPL